MSQSIFEPKGCDCGHITVDCNCGGGGASSTIVNEHPSGTMDGVNTHFETVYDFVSGTTRLYMNGLRQTFLDSYSESGTKGLELSFAPLPGDVLIIDYELA
jgi:hypothetical protein